MVAPKRGGRRRRFAHNDDRVDLFLTWVYLLAVCIAAGALIGFTLALFCTL